MIFIESGGDNLAATFSPELADLTIHVIDVSAGDKIPRKGGSGITRSDLLVINKIDLAELVGASLEVMDRDAKRMRGERAFLSSNLKARQGVDEIVRFIKYEGGLTEQAQPKLYPRYRERIYAELTSRAVVSSGEPFVWRVGLAFQ